MWQQRQKNDVFVQLRDEQNFRSRAAFKLLEIQEKFRIIPHDPTGFRVVDLGASPGSWLQVLHKVLLPSPANLNVIVGVDLNHVEPIPGVKIINGDMRDKSTVDQISTFLPFGKADLVVCDMAPPACGDNESDHFRIVGLIEEAFNFCTKSLEFPGVFVCKISRGGHEKDVSKFLATMFREVRFYKPAASRSESAEIYLICKEMLPSFPYAPIRFPFL
eukprot:TRINITY_DN7902_c0_g1_i1.p1 TRINITY_DN7902_c0_g1~~TRINITY_DN7902_c0_g1_i1.p1  ORF type:complete len:254 (-),score=69.04 TRINITY_DN7902_c0_g1_i1:39-692(-)